MRRVLLLAAAAALLAACGKGEQAPDPVRPVVTVTVAPGAAPSAPFVMSETEVRDAVGPALRVLPQPPVRFVLYFKWDSTTLSAESAARVADVVRTISEPKAQ